MNNKLYDIYIYLYCICCQYFYKDEDKDETTLSFHLSPSLRINCFNLTAYVCSRPQ